MSAGDASSAPFLAIDPRATLPSTVTPLIGREADMERVRSLLDGGETRLLTLTGPGGIGKTRLALAAADSLEGEFAHGARFVGLASVREPDDIPTAIARALGLQDTSDRAASDLMLAALRERHLLLILDNLEHIIDGAATWIHELLHRCPRLVVLATSRYALRLASEQRYQVPHLELPDVPTVEPDEPIAVSAAVELFVQRARAVRPEFALTTENAETVRRICLALDGLPLAIELAAARLNVLSLDELLGRLADRLAILYGTTRDAEPRHRTMRDTIAWSHDLLSGEQQALFRRLSVFTGGFSLEAAEAVGGEHAMDLLTDLLDQSLVQLSALKTGESRYRMLEVIREFGLERLEAAGEIEAAHEAHAAWVFDQAQRFEHGVEGHEQIAWLHRVSADHSNIRTALAWLGDRDRLADAQDLAGSLWMYFSIRGFFDESRRLYESLVDHPRGQAATIGRAKALLGLSVILSHQAAPEGAISVLDEAGALFNARADQRRLALARISRGMALSFLGRFEDSTAVTRDALALSREIGFRFGIAATTCNLGLDAAVRIGDSAEAFRLMQESTDVARTTGNRWGQALGLENLGFFELQAGRLDIAERLILEAHELFGQVGSVRDLPMGLADLAELALRKGDPNTARQRIGESLASAERTGDNYARASILQVFAEIERSAGNLGEATAALRHALEIWREFGNEPAYADCFDILADIAISAGDMTLAARMVGAADGIWSRGDQRRIENFPDQHERRLASITGSLGKRRFHESWEAGRASSIDNAMAEALAWRPPSGAVLELLNAATASESVAGLTPRELEVLRLMTEGLTNQQIADRLFVSKRTAATHVGNILARLDLPSRTAAVAWALRTGID